jgi:hypothetical protein
MVVLLTQSVASGAVHQVKLTAADGASNDLFGYAVAASGDTAVIGAFRDDDSGSDSGSAYVFARSGSSWTQQAKLTAADGATNDFFGSAVAGSEDTAVVGAFGDDDKGAESGSAYVFARSGTTWAQQAKLRASDGAASDAFGFSIAVSGDTAVISAYQDDDLGTNSGSVYVFMRTGTTWTQQAKLTPTDGAAGDFFGRAVALSGDTAVIGANQDDDRGAESGSAYVFTRSGTTWALQAKLTAPDGAASDFFGWSLAASGDTAVVGAFQDDDRGTNSGSAYVFARAGATWSLRDKLTASDGVVNDAFGFSVAATGDTAVVGAYGDDDQGASTGSAYVNLTDDAPPSISATVSPSPNAARWNNTIPVTVTFACSDPESGIASCSAPVVLTAETAAQVVSGTAYDNAGNVASASVTVHIDVTAPSVVTDDPSMGTGLPLPAGVITGSATDALSGVDEVEVTFTNLLTSATETRNAILTGDVWSVPTAGLTPGPTSASAAAIDFAGNPTGPSAPVLFLALV